MAKPKKITLAILYDLMMAGFDSMNTRFDRRFDASDRLQRKMAARLISIEARQKEHSEAIASLQTRVETLHTLIENLGAHSARLEQEYMMITAGLKRLETRFDRLEAEGLKERIESLEKRVDDLEKGRGPGAGATTA